MTISWDFMGLYIYINIHILLFSRREQRSVPIWFGKPGVISAKQIPLRLNKTADIFRNSKNNDKSFHIFRIIKDLIKDPLKFRLPQIFGSWTTRSPLKFAKTASCHPCWFPWGFNVDAPAFKPRADTTGVEDIMPKPGELRGFSGSTKWIRSKIEILDLQTTKNGWLTTNNWGDSEMVVIFLYYNTIRFLWGIDCGRYGFHFAALYEG